MASTLPHSHSPQLAGGKGPGPLLAGPCCPGGRGQTLSGSVLLPARSCGLSWSAHSSTRGVITLLVGGSEHGGALDVKSPTLPFSRPEPGTSQGYHPHMGRERPRSACGTGPAHWGRRSPPTLLAPCSRAHGLQLWPLTTPWAQITGPLAPGRFSAWARPHLTVSPFLGALLGLLGATVAQPHLMYPPGRGGAPLPGGFVQFATTLALIRRR